MAGNPMVLLVALALAPALCFGQDGTGGKAAIPPVYTRIVVTAVPDADPLQPGEKKPSEVFTRTLFSRDDQVFHILDAGINAGQHEGGGKSLEIRRFGFNLDHGGVNGGLKVLVDNVQQNQTTQGHGQGYLGSLKSLTPELIQEVEMIDGPFSAEYGDFSGLGVVHIRLREELPDQLTLRLQGGSFGSVRAFAGYSPQLRNGQMFAAYEGSRTDGPFVAPLNYLRDNFTGHYGRAVSPVSRFGFRFNGGRNRFDSSGQVPMDEVAAGRLDAFGYIDPTGGGNSGSGTATVYWQRESGSGATLRADAFAARSLLDLYSNFTFFLNDPVHGDGFQQHDSRLQEGANFHAARPFSFGWGQAILTGGGNYHDNQIRVGLYSRAGRIPLDTLTSALARVVNGAAYTQGSVSLAGGAVLLGGGLRYDEFHFGVNGAAERAGRWQPKASAAWTPVRRVPAKVHVNYGRGISTADARGIVQNPDLPRIATTDFLQAGVSYRLSRLSATGDVFLIRRSNELVYIADDGSFEFEGPSRAHGVEGKLQLSITRKLSVQGGLTKVGNAYFRGTHPRQYVVRAPHLVANAAVTLASWKGWSGSLRMRAINRYRADSADPSVFAAGHTVWDFGLARQIRRGVEFNLTVDNLTNRLYWETQNYFESRLQGQDPAMRLHGTPGYPRTVMVGLTFRGWGK